MKLFHVVTTPPSLSFIKRQAGFIRSHGVEVHVVSSPGKALDNFGKREQISTHSVLMTRRISPLRDILSVLQLFALFRRERPDIVHAHTPKASLIAMLAAWMARVPCRIFHIHGLPHSTATGLSRKILKWSTKIPCALATQILSVSQSVAAMAADEGICRNADVTVLVNGSSNGVDATSRFCPDKLSKTQSKELFGFTDKDLVVGFAGRLVRDKGVCELYRSWTQICKEFPHAYLLIAGPVERRDALPENILKSLHSDPRIYMLGHFKDMSAFYSSLDVFALPTYREGLPTVILESAAMAVPAIATRAVGCVDAVIDGVTGLLVDVGNHAQLTEALRKYLSNPELREQHGRQARARVLEHFKPEDVWQATLEQYQLALKKGIQDSKPNKPILAIKRAIDIAVSGMALLLLFPLLLIIAALIRLWMGSPVLFRQLRPGLNERPFQMIKFRTMCDAQDSSRHPLPDSQRLTSLGQFLRSTSLDEIPELWNVLKGDMSLVGPRPLLPEYLPRYSDFQRRRHQVKPGVTGWAQVNGRNALSWEDRFKLDVWYVENQSVWLDLTILWRTMLTVVKRHGIAQSGHATMPEFAGSADSRLF